MQQDPLLGAMLGKYKILAPLGQGGMARVYKARQENLDREVAIKVLPPWYAADRNFVERFEQEARLVARLSHPNIVTVHDASQQNGHLYIVMQLVDGGTLKNQIDNLRDARGTILAFMDLLEANRIFQQLASALARTGGDRSDRPGRSRSNQSRPSATCPRMIQKRVSAMANRNPRSVRVR